MPESVSPVSSVSGRPEPVSSAVPLSVSVPPESSVVVVVVSELDPASPQTMSSPDCCVPAVSSPVSGDLP